MSVIIDYNAKALTGPLDQFPRKAPRVLKDVHRRIGRVVQRRAKKNAPISPTKGQISANLKKGAIKRGASTKVRFNTNGTVSILGSTLKSKRQGRPGTLTRSIDVWEVSEKGVAVGVPLNSGAGKYADYIENGGPSGRGEWQNRGLGTRAKGPQADDKYTERAVEDAAAREIPAIIGKAIDDLTRDLR